MKSRMFFFLFLYFLFCIKVYFSSYKNNKRKKINFKNILLLGHKLQEPVSVFLLVSMVMEPIHYKYWFPR